MKAKLFTKNFFFLLTVPLVKVTNFVAKLKSYVTLEVIKANSAMKECFYDQKKHSLC